MATTTAPNDYHKESPSTLLPIISHTNNIDPTNKGDLSINIIDADYSALFDPKNLALYQELGRTAGITRQLNSNHETGLEDSQIPSRQDKYGINKIPKPQPPSFIQLLWAAYLDRTLILLTIAAFISLAIGIHNDIRLNESLGWLEGTAIIIAVVIVVLVNAINDWQRDCQFRRLLAKNEDRLVNVVRNGGTKKTVSIYDLVVGDIVLLAPGDVIPADGVLIEGFGLLCDESSATGESEMIKKNLDTDPFFLSSTKILDGTGSMIIVAVGKNSFHGRMMVAMHESISATPLQLKLDLLAESIARWGLAAALFLFLTLSIKYSIISSLNGWPPMSVTLQQFLHLLIQSITIVVVAVPEGLPMAVTLALAYATTRMLSDNNLVRVLAACETMGNATCICSDKTGTLTENKMTVVSGIFNFDPEAINADEQELNNKHEEKKLFNRLPPKITLLLAEGIAVNSTAFKDSHGYVGSKTEAALLEFAQLQLSIDYNLLRNSAKIVQVFPFSSERKLMCTVVECRDKTNFTDNSNEPPPVRGKFTKIRFHLKGAAEIILEKCDKFVNHNYSLSHEQNFKETNELMKGHVQQKIEGMAGKCLRTIALAYVEQEIDLSANMQYEIPNHGLTLLGIVGIEDPLRDGVIEAIKNCQQAGIFVRMVTGDNLVTAESIARKCGILQRGGISMEGHKFRTMDPIQRDESIIRLQVLARSSPLDKQVLVKKLREMDEIVAVTGDGTNDGPALKSANVGFAMGQTGTEVAKEASSIILMDDNFTSIVKAVGWGRCVNDAVRKFLQFQLTVNVAAVATCFGTALFDSKDESVLSAVQLLWINLIMDTGAALALATDRPTPNLLTNRHPEPPGSPLVTKPMWKLIIGQATFQTFIMIFFRFYLGPHWFGLDMEVTKDRLTLFTMLFNLFVFMQLFNEINAHELDPLEFNPLRISRIFSNWIFVAIWTSTTMIQLVLIYFGGEAFSTTPLNIYQLLISIGIAFITIPIGIILKLLPLARSHVDPSQRRIFLSRERLQWQASIRDVQKRLAVFNALRRAQTAIPDIK